MARGAAKVSVVTTLGKVWKMAVLVGQIQMPFTTIALGRGIAADSSSADANVLDGSDPVTHPGMQLEFMDSGLERVVTVPTGDNAGKMTWTWTFTATAAKTVGEIGIYLTGYTLPGIIYLHSTLGSANDVVLAAGDVFKVTITDQA